MQALSPDAQIRLALVCAMIQAGYEPEHIEANYERFIPLVENRYFKTFEEAKRAGPRKLGDPAKTPAHGNADRG